MIQEESAGVHDAFNVGIELMRTSPGGLVRCAADWLEASKGSYGFNVEDRGFAAANQALCAAPDIFVGAGGDSWSESARPRFWRLFFEARAGGLAVADLKSALSKLPKAVLALGAKDMLMSAARFKDAASFGELLDMGAVRRSKLVMFSAYQNGGKNVALQVKVPTALEAGAMLDSGRRSWMSSNSMVHDVEGFLWLMQLWGKPIGAMTLARIVGRAEDPPSFEKAVGESAGRIDFFAEPEYFPHLGRSIAHSEEDRLHGAILGLSSAGSPQAAKALAIAKGGPALWSKACRQGFAGMFKLPVRKASPQGNLDEASVGYIDEPRAVADQARSTPQHGAALSRDPQACAWLLAEYEAMGAPWLGAQTLAKAYKALQVKSGAWGAHWPSVSEEALSLSEFIDLRGGLQAGKLGTARKRSRSL